MILGVNICDKFVQAIRTGDKVIDLKDESMISVIHDGLRVRQRSQQKIVGTSHGHVKNN